MVVVKGRGEADPRSKLYVSPDELAALTGEPDLPVLEVPGPGPTRPSAPKPRRRQFGSRTQRRHEQRRRQWRWVIISLLALAAVMAAVAVYRASNGYRASASNPQNSQSERSPVSKFSR